jgi:hypothetical protein
MISYYNFTIWRATSSIKIFIFYQNITLDQACATSGPRAGCDPRNSIVRPSATTQVLSFVKPAISNIERSKAVKEFFIARAPNK